jgi:hypothetical protein
VYLAFAAYGRRSSAEALDPSARRVSAIARAIPAIRILATSRRSLLQSGHLASSVCDRGRIQKHLGIEG